MLAYKELLDLLQYLYLVSQPTPTLHEILIAKINVEMQRLRQTIDRVRQHLIETYGKRGRFLLTDEQLHEFLQYLQSQSDPRAGF